MPSTTTLVFALAIASTIAPTLAVPVYGPYSSNLARRNEQVARDLAYLIARTDESGALNWQQVKDFGKKAWAGVKTAARVAQPIVSALASREEAELFARLDEGDQALFLRELIDRNQDSGALNTQGVKKFGSKVYHGALDFVHNVGPLVHDGAEITEALKGRDEAGLWARELDARENAAYELIARALYDLD